MDGTWTWPARQPGTGDRKVDSSCIGEKDCPIWFWFGTKKLLCYDMTRNGDQEMTNKNNKMEWLVANDFEKKNCGKHNDQK